MKGPVEFELIERIEAISTKRGARFDQRVRNIVQIIVDKGADYSDTKHGDMTGNLLDDLLAILERGEE